MNKLIGLKILVENEKIFVLLYYDPSQASISSQRNSTIFVTTIILII